MPDVESTGRPTLRQLIAGGPLEDAEVLAGRDGLDGVVSDVLIVERLDDTTEVPPGGLVFVNAAAFESGSYVLDVAVRRLSELGGAGLVAANPRGAPSIATCRLADRFSVPLLLLRSADILGAAYEVREVFSAPEVRRAAVVRDLLAQLPRADESGIDGLVGAASTLLRRLCALVQAEGVAVAGAVLTVSTEFLSDRAHPYSAADDEVRVIVAPVRVLPGESLGFWLVCELELREWHLERTVRDVLGVLAWAVGAHIVKERLAREHDARHRLALLNEIVGGGDLPEEAIGAQMATVGWSSAGWISAFHVQVSGRTDPAWILASSDPLADLLAAEGMGGPLIERTDGWSGWVCSPNEPRLAGYRALVGGLERALEELADSTPGIGLHGGIGRPARGLPGLRSGLAEARQAAMIAGAGGRRFGARHIDELGVQRIMLGWYTSEEFADLAAGLLQPLVDIDPDGELLRTVEAYLDAESSATNAAAVLGVHRNTVTQRMLRVAAAVGVDLHDPDERLALQLVLRMQRLRGAER